MSSTSNRKFLQRQRIYDSFFQNITKFFAFLVLATLLGIIISLIIGAMPSIKQFGFNFLINDSWDPVKKDFGAWSPILGTLITSFIALFIGVPVSFGIALFLTELSPLWMRRPLGIAVELLAGIPSIIYGMWGLFVFAPFFSDYLQPHIIEHIGSIPLIGLLFTGAPMGIGMFTAGLILSIMVIPYISSVMRDVFELVPTMYKESAYGLGATTWEVVRYVVLPYTKTGVVGGIMLGLGRALGETMAVTFVIGNAHDIKASLFMPGTSIASALANEFTEADGVLYTSALIELGLILFGITFVVLTLSKILLLQLRKAEGSQS
ncbi:phosphate ABC transporter permease subunit PstC [Parachitinimonas caeni]|uniref:Phosphate transport system permease protein n=1 Tax=Parachitinimonas caeni TaxID=3031301 RepID=A0ABT7DY95_9NEIS|nr:phosphate ABC transporter permease subunit PstC [Parachitinimonas caeni]MDK2124794.1 phosphate ABC transporter permease subunit PstC [Parachitinimonas caeni]